MTNAVEDILGTDRVYNPEAARMLRMARKEKNRIRVYKMIKVAKRLEERYRKSRKLWLIVGKKTQSTFVRELEYNVPCYTKVRKLI